MKASKLVHLLKLFSDKEWKRFEKYLNAPYLNSNKRLVVFYKVIAKYHPDFSHPKFEKEKIFPKIFPEIKEFSDNRLRDLMSKFRKAAEEFLAHQQIQNNSNIRQDLIIKSLGEKNYYTDFLREIEALEEKLENQKIRDTEYFWQKFDLNYRRYYHPQTQKLRPDIKSFQSMIENLDLFFTLSKLKIGLEVKIRQKIVPEKIRLPYFEAAKIEAKFNSEAYHFFNIYLNINRLIEGEEGFELLRNLKNDFENNLSFFSKDEQARLLIFLLNQVSRNSKNTPLKDVVKLESDLYLIGLNNELWIKNEQMPVMVFLNIVELFSAQKDFVFVSDFLEKYQKNLAKNIRSSIIQISQAKLHFYKKEFEDVTQIIAKLQTSNSPFNLMIRRLNVQCHLELAIRDKSWEYPLEDCLRAHENYLRRNKDLADFKKEKEQNLLRLVRLVKLYFYCEKTEEKQRLRNQILLNMDESAKLNGRRWLSRLMKKK